MQDVATNLIINAVPSALLAEISTMQLSSRTDLGVYGTWLHQF